MQIHPLSIAKSFMIGLLSVFFVAFLTFASWALWERNRDALGAIDFYPGQIELLHDTSLTLSFKEIPDRIYRHITLSTEHLGNIEAFISEPKVIPAEGLPVVIIMGGLEVDAEIFRQILDPGDNIFVIFKYPYTPEYWYDLHSRQLITRKALQHP